MRIEIGGLGGAVNVLMQDPVPFCSFIVPFLHGGLSAMTVLIEVTGNAVDRMIPVPLGWRKKSAIRTLAESSAGRAAIANTIGEFYFAANALGWGKPPFTIGVAFEMVRPKFIGIGLWSDSPCAKY